MSDQKDVDNNSDITTKTKTKIRLKVALYAAGFFLILIILNFFIPAITRSLRYEPEFYLGYGLPYVWAYPEYYIKIILFTLLYSIHYLIDLLVIIAGVWLASKYLFQPKNLENLAEGKTKVFLNQFFDSEDFLTILRTALPNGKESKDHGFDFIPFMLHTVEEKRKRFEKSSRNFLWLTFILGLLFSGCLIFFAYLLINEAAAGTQKTIADMETSTRAIAKDVSILRKQDTPKFIETYIAPLVYNSRGNTEAIDELKDFIDNYPTSEKTIYDLLDLMKSNNTESKLVFLTADEKSEYRSAIQQIEKYLEQGSDAALELPKLIQNVESLTQKVNENLAKPENRTPEIIKRLFLSLVLATFFIALLRYVVKLYRDHYQQLIFAEQESLAIRKFYVAYKCSKDEEQRKTVLTAFMMNKSADISSEIKDGSPSFDNINPELLKEILSAITKKL